MVVIRALGAGHRVRENRQAWRRRDGDLEAERLRVVVVPGVVPAVDQVELRRDHVREGVRHPHTRVARRDGIPEEEGATGVVVVAVVRLGHLVAHVRHVLASVDAEATADGRKVAHVDLLEVEVLRLAGLGVAEQARRRGSSRL